MRAHTHTHIYLYSLVLNINRDDDYIKLQSLDFVFVLSDCFVIFPPALLLGAASTPFSLRSQAVEFSNEKITVKKSDKHV